MLKIGFGDFVIKHSDLFIVLNNVFLEGIHLIIDVTQLTLT